MTRHLLPPNATPRERAQSETSARLLDVPTELVRLVKRPETCPPELLAHLAFERAVKVWDPNWPVDLKRDVIAASYPVKARGGTRGAMRRSLEALGLGLQISEWFEYGGLPYRFRLSVTLPAGASWTARQSSIAVRTALGAKNARSRLERLDVHTSGSGARAYVGAAVSSRIRIKPSVDPVSYIAGRASFSVGQATWSRIRIRPLA